MWIRLKYVKFDDANLLKQIRGNRRSNHPDLNATPTEIPSSHPIDTLTLDVRLIICPTNTPILKNAHLNSRSFLRQRQITNNSRLH